MEIELRTRRNNPIENEQYTGPLPYKDIHDNEKYMKTYSGYGVIWRTNPTGIYNCHGLAFASRRTRIFSNPALQMILKEDGYKKVEIKDVFPGDIILYITENNDITHSGIVLGKDDSLFPCPFVLSKWGNGSEVYHAYNNCPYYSGDITTEFYRCDS